MGTRRLHIVVSCTDRKRADVPQALRARTLVEQAAERRTSEWARKLRDVAVPSVRAIDLYAGDHFATARGTVELAAARGYEPDLWILSAGFGLLRSNDAVKPYSATFAARESDAVATPQCSSEEWWQGVTSRVSRRNLATLAGDDPNAIIIVAASVQYIDAIEADLAAASERLREASNLIVITSKDVRPHAEVPGYITAERVLQNVLGGSLTSLHIRVARYVIETFAPAALNYHAAASLVASTTASAPPFVVHDRLGGSDEDISRYIRDALARDSSLTHSRLLRQFRDAGRACEQKRFRNLFQKVARS